MIHYVCKVAGTMSFYKCNGTTNLRALLALYHKVGTINTYHLFNTNDMFHSPCLNHIFQHTLYARLILSILPMQNIRPSGGNTFFPSPRFQLILCHTFVLCNDTVAYAQMVGRAFAFHALRNSLRSLLRCGKAPPPSSPLGFIAIFRHHPLLDLLHLRFARPRRSAVPWRKITPRKRTVTTYQGIGSI